MQQEEKGNGRSKAGAFTGWLLGAATPLVWGAAGASLVLVLLPHLLGQQPQGPQLAAVDIAKVLQEYNLRALRNPEDRGAVGAALDAAADAAGQVDTALGQLAALHPGVVFIQPQALAYQGNVADMTGEFRALLARQGAMASPPATMAAAPAPAQALLPATAPPVLPLGQVLQQGGSVQPAAPALPIPAQMQPPVQPAASKPSWDVPR
jgi:hypothetical protein